MRRLSRGSAVDSHDVGTVRRATFRTRLVRVMLVVAALALLVGAAASARNLDAGRTNGLPTASGVAVVDLSLSIGPQDYQTIRATVRRLIASDGSPGSSSRCSGCSRRRRLPESGAWCSLLTRGRRASRPAPASPRRSSSRTTCSRATVSRTDRSSS